MAHARLRARDSRRVAGDGAGTGDADAQRHRREVAVTVRAALISTVQSNRWRSCSHSTS